jgi:hypothetical protein
MSFGVLSGFTPTKIATTAATTVKSSPCYVAARLTAGAAAAKMRIFNTASGTAAASLVSILAAGSAQTADETGVPIRCDVGCTVLMSVNTATGFVYVR